MNNMIVHAYLLSVEVMCEFSIRVTVAYTDSSPPLIPLNVCDSVIPESS